MRVLKLTHEEIEMIEEALDSFHKEGINVIDKSNPTYFTIKMKEEVLKNINKKAMLKEQISQGEKDI